MFRGGETHNQKVVCSNPGTGYWMDVFHIDLLLNLYCLFEKEAEDGRFKKLVHP